VKCLLAAFFLLPLAGQTARVSLAEPAVAPDRAEVVFVSGGDIWTAPLAGGEARLLISHPAAESRPLYSPDGKRLAFTSTRSGGVDIYVLELGSAEIRRVTYDDAAERLDAWSPDGKYLYFSSASRDIAGSNDIYRVSAEGGTPMQVSADRFAGEYWAAPSPDGKSLAFTARGMPSGQWWRRGHSHIDESQIWTVRFDAATPVYEKFSGGGTNSKETWPMWAADGKRIYFVSDRDGSENLYVREAGRSGPARKLTSFSDGRLLWPNISYDGRTIVFERDFAIWRFETGSGRASRIEIVLRGAPAGPSVTRLNISQQFRDLAVSPDGKKAAFLAHGEIFAVSAKDGGSAARVTTSDAAESNIVWTPDSRRLTYVSDRDGNYAIYQYDFVTNAETKLIGTAAGESGTTWSPDGKLHAFVRGGKELMVYDPATKQERQLATGYFGKPAFGLIEWSPDSQWIAFPSLGVRGFQNVSVVAAAGGAARPVTFIPNTYINSIEWSPDGKYLLFSSGQRTEPSAVIRVDLVPTTPKFREDLFRDLFKEQLPGPTPPKPETSPAAQTPEAKPVAEAAKKTPVTVEINFEGIRRRVRVLPIGMDASGLRISPDGKTLLFSSSAAGQPNFYTYSLDELAKEPPVARQLTSTAGGKSSPQWSADSKEVWYLESGRIHTINVENRQTKPLAATAEMDVDFSKEKMQVFTQAWRYLNDRFYDPNFHGVDWGAMKTRYEPHVAGARTQDEMRRIVSLMLGELNASHLGIMGGSDGPPVAPTGKTGLRFDRVEYEANGRFRITEVISLSPADVAGVKAGGYLVAVDGVALTAAMNLDQLLNHKVDRRVELTIADDASGTGKRDIVLRPVNTATEKNLLYRQWVESRRDYVHRMSKGRLGYVHMPDMGMGSLQQLYLDLDTENQARDGVVIDIRNNNGGFVNAYALDVLARRPYLHMTPRDQETAPARSMLGQRALEKPTILVTNMESLSDAEDFTEGYRTLKIGKVVGEPTAGWIIYTGGVELIDGSVLRLPMIKITTNDGVNMELNPRPVDIRVDRPIGEWYTGKDSQLDAAIRELLAQIG
jgi:tricorn protease